MSATTRDPTKAVWLGRLHSALRTTLACTIVGCTTLYGPASIRRFLAYPAFSYVTTILIVSDATLGDTLRGCWHVLYATIQAIISSAPTLWVIGPARFNSVLAAVAVAITTFLVALPQSTPLMAKRIAFGQIVIVYVGTVIHGARTGVVMQPIHVVSSTALGAIASVIAMLIPYPRLAYQEVRKTCRLYVENASERLNLFVEAFTAQEKQAATDLMLQAKILSKTGVRHLRSIKDGQGGMMWEKPQLRFLNSNCMDLAQNLQEVEIPIRGMEIALSSCPTFPIGMVDERLREVLPSMKGKIGLKLEQAKCFAPFDATTAPETNEESQDISLWTPKTSATTQEELPAFLFVNCMLLLQGDSAVDQKLVGKTEKTDAAAISSAKNQLECGLIETWNSLVTKLSGERLIFAIKCSISLGFAVLFGLIFNKENGYWSGLTIAISFVTGRQATFNAANSRAQGTAMGSVYGVLCCFIFQSFTEFRFLPLLPWIIFASFLRHSRMYGQAGGISAVIGALLILGRKNYGPPNEFAITRISEACIGLMCFIMVEILFQPTRAATLAKAELAQSLEAFRDCVKNIVLEAGQRCESPSITATLRGKHEKLRSHINGLKKFVAEAESEPHFWFIPFHGACYGKLLGSLRKIEDLLLFAVYQIEILSQESGRLGVDYKEIVDHLSNEMDIFQEKVCSSLKCLKEVTLIDSQAVLEKKLQMKNKSSDIESGKSQGTEVTRSLSPDEEATCEVVNTFLQQSNEVAKKINESEGDEKLKSRMILSLSGLGFCIGTLMKETRQIEKEVKELIAWENPTRNVNLYEMSCKINSQYTK